MPRPRRAPGDHPSVRAGAAAARRVVPRLSVPHQAAGASWSGRPVIRIPSWTRPCSDAPTICADKADRLFEFDLYLVVLYDGWTARTRRHAGAPAWGDGARQTLRPPALVRPGRERPGGPGGPGRAGAAARRRTRSSCSSRTPWSRALLTKGEAFRFFRQLAELRAAQGRGVPLKYDTHLDFYAADSGVDCHRDHLEVDGYAREGADDEGAAGARPSRTCSRTSARFPSAFIACLEWQRRAERRRCGATSTRAGATSSTSKVSLVNYVSPRDAAGGDARRRLGDGDGPRDWARA